MLCDQVFLHVLWRETSNRIEVLQGRVNEGLDVDAASEFCRWLRFSGILKLLESAPDDNRLPCKGLKLSQQVQKLTEDCGEYYAKHERCNTKPPAQIPHSQLEAINAQLAQLRTDLAKISPPNIETVYPAIPAGFHVIEGGVQT